MATQAEVKQCFEALRERLREANEVELKRLGAKLQSAKLEIEKEKAVSELAQNELFTQLSFMGLFLFESLLIDIKRIADAAEEEISLRINHPDLGR